MDSWANLTDDEIEATINAMPGGVDGYLTGWGWETFARAIEERLRLKNAPEAPLRPDMRAALEHVRTNLHEHACHADAFADHIGRLLAIPVPAEDSGPEPDGPGLTPEETRWIIGRVHHGIGRRQASLVASMLAAAPEQPSGEENRQSPPYCGCGRRDCPRCEGYVRL